MSQNNNQSSMVFTLHEDTPLTTESEPRADWERSLAERRNNRKGESFDSWQQRVEIKKQNYRQSIAPKLPEFEQEHSSSHSFEKFGDVKLDDAYRAYLQEREREHNASIQDSDEDVAVLIQEDWLAAQAALQDENERAKLLAKQTIILNKQQSEVEQPEIDSSDAAYQNKLPEIAVHVYDLPELPAHRRIKILSEQQLLQTVSDKLQSHLSNAVAGMVRQAVQKKLANIVYDLQSMLNEETPKLVQEVLEHNMERILRDIKDNA